MSKKHTGSNAYLSQVKPMSMVQIVRPSFVTRDDKGNQIIPQLSDYIKVPRMALIGTWSMLDVVPGETAVKMMRLRKRLTGVSTRR